MRTVGFLFLLVCFAGMLFSQGTDLGTLRGTVTDASGAVVPNAKVVITDLQTNIDREVKTNNDGNYEAFGLKAGSYKVVVTLPGFATEEITNITLHGSEVVRADARLQPAGTQQTVVITAEAPVIHTDDQTISQTLNNQALIELPRDSRDIYSFLYLNPNITQADSDGSFKFIGSQSYGASFSLDGQRSNGGIFGQPTGSQPSLEAVGELNILSNDFSAEYAGVATIRVETKRGGSEYHGSAFYNNKNSALAAWQLQDKIGQANFLPNFAQNKYPNPFFNITDIGGSLGGPLPLVKKTYFFFAYERNWNASPVQLRSTTLPHPTLYTGDFSLMRDSNKPLVPAGVTLTADEKANNTVGGLGARFIRIPPRLLNPVVQNLIKDYFPAVSTAAPINATNGRLTNYFNLLPGGSLRDLGTMRLDHDFSEKDRVYGVYNISQRNSDTSPVVSPFTGLGLTQNDQMNHTVSLSYTRLVKPNVVNEVRGGFNRQSLLRHSNQTLRQFLANIGFNDADITAYGAVVGPAALDTFGHPAVFFGTSGLQNFTNGGRNTFRPQDQNLITVGDTLTWLIGKHSLKMGADLVRNQAVDGFAFNRGNPRGRINYSGTAPDAFAKFLLGLPPNTVQYVQLYRPPMDVHNWEHGYFFQDDFRVSSRLTLNLGMRYELITPFVEKNDLLANFDPTYTTNGAQGRFVIPSTKTLQYLDPRIVKYGYTTADKIGLTPGLVRLDTTNFAPRVGAAWRITDKTVLRGGYGLYYPTSAAQGIRDPIGTNPFNQSLTNDNTDPNSPLQGWPGSTHGISPVSGGHLRTLGGAPSVNVVPFGLHQPRVQQYNVTFEQEVGWRTALRLSYLGTHMSGLIAGVDLNELQPSNQPFGTTTGDGVTPCDPVNNGDCNVSPADAARYRFPGLGDFIEAYGNFGHASSNAFQMEATHRYSNGLMFDISYTLLSQNSTALDTGNASLGGIAYNPFSPNADFGEDAFISRHRVVAYGIYELPIGKSRKYGSSMGKWADAIVGGWQTTWNMFAKTGTAFTPFWICDDCSPIEPGNIGVSSLDAVGDFGSSSFRPTVLSSNYQQKSGDRIFNPAAFGPPPIGADFYSNPAVAKRNILRGPGTWGVNLGVHKTFHFGEHVNAQFGADVNNVFNHPLFSPDQGNGGGGGTFALLGDFNVNVDQKTGKLLPITDITPNPDFGRLITSFSQEGIDSRRTVRLRLRITF
jgi:Carboxypeptidase regulatory-like domain/TonB dependent receptor